MKSNEKPYIMLYCNNYYHNTISFIIILNIKQTYIIVFENIALKVPTIEPIKKFLYSKTSTQLFLPEKMYK